MARRPLRAVSALSLFIAIAEGAFVGASREVTVPLPAIDCSHATKGADGLLDCGGVHVRSSPATCSAKADCAGACTPCTSDADCMTSDACDCESNGGICIAAACRSDA